MEEYDDRTAERPGARETAKPLALLQALPYAEVAVQGGRGGDRLVAQIETAGGIFSG